MDAEMAAELKREIIESLPGWIEREPGLRQRLQAALQKEAEAIPRFATFEDFIAWVDEDISAEWVDGEVIFMSPASTRHQLIANFLNHILDIFVQERHLGVILNAPYKMKLKDYGPEPDLIFVKQAHQDRIKDTYLDGPADLVVEIVLLGSIGRDRGDKFTAYEAAGIPEYWLIDPIRQRAEFYRLDEDGRYQLMPIASDGRYYSEQIPDFWLQVDWLWPEPLPRPAEVLRALNVF